MLFDCVFTSSYVGFPSWWNTPDSDQSKCNGNHNNWKHFILSERWSLRLLSASVWHFISSVVPTSTYWPTAFLSPSANIRIDHNTIIARNCYRTKSTESTRGLSTTFLFYRQEGTTRNPFAKPTYVRAHRQQCLFILFRFLSFIILPWNGPCSWTTLTTICFAIRTRYRHRPN